MQRQMAELPDRLKIALKHALVLAASGLTVGVLDPTAVDLLVQSLTGHDTVLRLVQRPAGYQLPIGHVRLLSPVDEQLIQLQQL